MRKTILFIGLFFLLMAAAADPLDVRAEGEPLASPTPQPNHWVTAPVISGENPGATLLEGDLGDITPSGSSIPWEVPDPIDPPFACIQSKGSDADPVILSGDVSCGPAALAQAMKLHRLESAPSPEQLEDFLRARGLMHPWGTGVEGLVFAARQFGFPSARVFHHWPLEVLNRVIRAGDPVIVSLRSKRPGKPGHFSVLIGLSLDGEWYTCSDPLLGVFKLSRDEFLSLWELQGRAGVLLTDFPLTASADFCLVDG